MVPDDLPRAPILLLARWLQETTHADNLGDGLEIVLGEMPLPDDVRAALKSLRGVPLRRRVECGGESSILDAISAVEKALANKRRSDVFWPRISLRPPTLEALGSRLKVTRERVRQLQVRAEDSVKSTLEGPACATFRSRVSDLAQRLGRMAPASAQWVSEAISLALVDVPSPWQLRMRDLTLWSAGYCQDSSGWLRRGPTLAKEDIIQGLVDNDQRIDLGSVRRRLADAGLVAEALDAWLAENLSLRTIEGTTYLWIGSVVDKAMTLLSAQGVPASAEEIAAAVGEGHNVRATRSRLLEDSRFIRVDQYRIGLRSWGMDEYTGIVDEITEELERRGGETDVKDLVATVAATYDVSAASVATSTGAPRFIVADGRIRLRSPHEPYQPRRTLVDEPGCYLMSEDRCKYRLQVDPELLRGSGRRIPEGLGSWLRVSPGERRLYTFDESDQVPVSWPDTASQGPSIGSLRRVAEILGASAGDLLIIEFDRVGSTAHTALLRAERVASVDGRERLALLTGLTPMTGSFEERLARAVGASGLTALRDRLRRRGEEELIELLPKQLASDLDAALERLRDVL